LSKTKLSGYYHFQNYPEIDDQYPLIGPGDPPPFITYNDHGKSPVLLVADHASPFFPAAMNQLGLADWVLERHVAWDIGIMWDKDPRIPVPLIARFDQMDGICIGDNEPYSGRHPNDFTIDYRAESDGLPHVGIEVRQDLVTDTEGARKWAGILAAGLGDILADKELYRTLGSGQ